MLKLEELKLTPDNIGGCVYTCVHGHCSRVTMCQLAFLCLLFLVFLKLEGLEFVDAKMRSC